MTFPMTEPCRQFRAEVFARYPKLTDLGYYNRRPIARSKVWSQHAWGNAQDLGGPVVTLDLAAAWLQANRSRLNIRVLLWRVPDHYDHIHVDFNPKQIGTPPLPGEEDDDMEMVKGVQRSLNAAGWRGKNGKPLVVDGKWGENTEFAYARFVAETSDGALPPGAHTFTVRAGTLNMEVT